MAPGLTGRAGRCGEGPLGRERPEDFPTDGGAGAALATAGSTVSAEATGAAGSPEPVAEAVGAIDGAAGGAFALGAAGEGAEVGAALAAATPPIGVGCQRRDAAARPPIAVTATQARITHARRFDGGSSTGTRAEEAWPHEFEVSIGAAGAGAASAAAPPFGCHGPAKSVGMSGSSDSAAGGAAIGSDAPRSRPA